MMLGSELHPVVELFIELVSLIFHLIGVMVVLVTFRNNHVYHLCTELIISEWNTLKLGYIIHEFTFVLVGI